MNARRNSRPGLAWSFFFALVSLVSGVTATKAGQKQGAVYTNHLAGEKSPYLLQHAHNPVDWYPWGDAAFAKARKENKPIFLSIGYSTCHWCHVMAHESFENEQTAAIMNREFVNIKVDREERPDVDRVYMTFVQATTGGGGWPMSVWLTPELKPFVGGTYFPPEDRHGQPGFPKVLQRIAAAWKENREKISEQGSKIMEALQQAAASGENAGGNLDAEVLQSGAQQMARMFDAREGGFGGAPKFPRPVILNFLLRMYAREGASSTAGRKALDMTLLTLRKMAAGGIHDQIGGGFHRYSVDALWHVPHFEKMLYDQAQLAVSYLEAFQVTHESELETVARDTLDYVGRDLRAQEGGFYSAEDADSVVAGSGDRGDKEKAEGAFYVWTKKEIDDSLGEEAAMFDYHYGVEAEGNAPGGSDPQGEFRGKNVLIRRHTVAETAKHVGKNDEEVRTSLQKNRKTLFDLRAKRPRPHLDDKIITAWNGLMISAYARAAQVLNDRSYAETAATAANFLRTHLYDTKTKRLARNYRDGKGEVEGFAEDYAFLIQGLLDLYEATFDVNWLQWALDLQKTQDELFLDKKHGGYFSTTGKDKSVLLRMKDDNDGAEPSASSVSALNLLRLAQMREAKPWEAEARKTIDAFSGVLRRAPTAMPQMLSALDFALGKPRQIVLAGKKEADDTRKLLREIRGHFLPNTVVLLADGGKDQKYLAETHEEIGAMKMVDEKAAAYVCENFTCKAPVSETKGLRKLLGRSSAKD